MNTTAQLRRTGVAASLVCAAALSILWVVLQPPMGDSSDWLATLAEAGATAAVSAFAFTLSQVVFIIAAMGIAHLIADRAPVFAAIGAGLAVLGGFGHAVTGGAQLVQVGMAADTANHDVYNGLLAGGLPGPLMMMMLAGTIGTVLGLIMLGVGLLRAKTSPRWVPYTLWAFVLVEFIGSNFTAWASLVSGLLYLASFVALAITVWRSPVALWQSGTMAQQQVWSAAP
ncbi:hypothetical protein ACXR2W_13060 [Leucobacter sp. HY1908]